MMLSAGNGFIMQSDKYSRYNAGQSLKKYILLKKGELAYNHGASKAKQFGCCYELLEDEALIPYVYHCFKVDKNEYTPYVAFLLNNPKIDRQLKRLVSSSARMDGLLNISFKDYMSINLSLPPYAEQKQVSDFIKRIDERIVIQEQLISSLKKYKRGSLSALFPKKREITPQYRFAGFTKPWEQRKLGDIADIVGGGTPSTGNQSYWDGDIDWYAPAEIADQIYANSSQKKITGLGYENSSAKMLPPGTVLFTSRAGIGKTAILTRKGCTNQGFQSIVPHRGELDSYFIFSRTEELKRYGELVGAGSTFVEVSGKQMAVMELMMPPTMREQQTIGGFFQQLDHLITLHQHKYDILLSLKNALLQQMFI